MLGSQHRVALYLQDKHPLSEAIEHVRYAEAHGFEAVWQAESRLVRDAVVPMAAYAATTERKPKQVPLYIGATGPKMMELSGEIADGVLLNYLVSPAYNREAMNQLRTGAARAGRSLEEIDRPQLIVCSLDEDRARALDNAR